MLRLVTRVVAAGVVGILMCVGVLLAAPANATPRQDDAFDAAIHKLGYNLADPEKFHTAGHVICNAIDAGVESWGTVVMMFNKRGFGDEKAAAISAATIVAYCPWNTPRDTLPRIPDRQSVASGPIV
ncbi:MAG: DUF732 domain-containing protein [Mycobacterium sp.]